MASFTFNVEGQHLRETDHRIVVSGSVRYLSADFHFSDDWGDIPKFAFFQKGTVTHKILLIDDKILPEQEIYLTDGNWLVSVLGEDVDGETINKRITTNEVYIHVDINGPTEGEPFEEITPSIGEQIIGEALKHATDAESAAEEAKRSEDSAKLYRNEAEQSENQAEASAKTAAKEAQKSFDSAQEAKRTVEDLPDKVEEYIDSHKEELKGDPGYTPQKGIDYFDGAPGYTPIKGIDYFDGEPGEPGKEYDDTEIRGIISEQNEGLAELNTEVNTTKAKLSEVSEIVEDNHLIYGFIERGDILAPNQRIEYIGANRTFTPMTMNMSTHIMSMGSWADFEWLLGNKPAMVKQDGTLDYWLNPNDYTKKEDGSASDVENVNYNGNAFAWIPKIYKHEEMLNDADRMVKFSMKPLEGFSPVGFVDEWGNELDGVWIPLFYGWRDSNGKMRSIANNDIATHSLNLQNEFNAINANGERYKFFGGSIIETLADIMLMFAKTTELQGAYGYGNRNGYVSTDTVTYGKTPNTATNCGQFYGSTDGKSINRVFHSMVLITHNQYQRDPYLIVDKGRWKVSPNYKHGFNGNTWLDGYVDTGVDLPNADANKWTYPNYRFVADRFGSIPMSEPNIGSTAVGICDGVYRSATQSSFVAVPLRFCTCNIGPLGGPRALDLHLSASDAYWYIGSSLLLLPPV